MSVSKSVFGHYRIAQAPPCSPTAIFSSSAPGEPVLPARIAVAAKSVLAIYLRPPTTYPPIDSWECTAAERLISLLQPADSESEGEDAQFTLDDRIGFVGAGASECFSVSALYSTS